MVVVLPELNSHLTGAFYRGHVLASLRLLLLHCFIAVLFEKESALFLYIFKKICRYSSSSPIIAVSG